MKSGPQAIDMLVYRENTEGEYAPIGGRLYEGTPHEITLQTNTFTRRGIEIGLAGSGNINLERTYPSLFEPVHGSAPDIAGKGIANPRKIEQGTAVALVSARQEGLACQS